jgi:hypothetical protein
LGKRARLGDNRRRVTFTGALGVLGALVALCSAAFALLQVREASLQNTAAERESLVSLVTEIAGQVGALQTAPAQRESVFTQTLAAEAAQGLALILALHDQSIPAVDDYEIGLAFENDGDDYDALASYGRAAKTTTSTAPLYRVSAVEDSARILFELGGSINNRAAERMIGRAWTLIADEPDVTRQQRAYAFSYDDLVDARYGSAFACVQARRDLLAAEGTLGRFSNRRKEPGTFHLDPEYVDQPIASLLRAAAAVANRCIAADLVHPTTTRAQRRPPRA